MSSLFRFGEGHENRESALGRLAGIGPFMEGSLCGVDGHVNEEDEPDTPRCCAEADGFGLHAGTALPAYDREGVEHLLRYMCRPPVALDRLEELPAGRLLYRLKKRWRDGTDSVVFEPRKNGFLDQAERTPGSEPPNIGCAIFP